MTPDEKHNMIEPYDAVDLNDIAEGDAADELYEHFAITVRSEEHTSELQSQR